MVSVRMTSLAATAPVAPAFSAADLLREAFWREQFPQLSIGTRLSEKLKPWRGDEKTLALMRQRMMTEGYFDGRDDKLAAKASALGAAVKRCAGLQIPPPFLFLFDEAWECFYRLHPMLARLLGEDYRFLPDFWVWHVDPARQESGWSPHRDKGKAALAADGSPLSLTLWIPLSEATPLNSCIYLLPADRDPVYNTPEEQNWCLAFPDIRALPARPGDFFCWNQAVLHWGSRASPYATQPRLSMALECQRGDAAPFNMPLIAPRANMDFAFRLRLVGKQILQYQHMYPLPPAMRLLAERMLTA